MPLCLSQHTQEMKDEKSRRERVELAAHSLHAIHTKQVYYECAENTGCQTSAYPTVAERLLPPDFRLFDFCLSQTFAYFSKFNKLDFCLF